LLRVCFNVSTWLKQHQVYGFVKRV
jgi:hypothetical protein